MGHAACPDDETLLAFLERAPTPVPREELAAHFDDCESCQQLITDLARAAADEQGGPNDRERDGDKVTASGRYVLLSALGAGAMGVVQAAFDRQLDRKVALKFLAATPGEDTARARARLQREAQALAKLAHPNVVTVHDVGVLDDEVYVAMELVEGSTLRTWLAARPRDLREVLAILRQAGEGLAAAHAAGLVHRDFKPDNVLVGDDGRARVTDFGLARSANESDQGSAPDAPGESARIATLTQTGVRAGTPAYMAPEQKAGEAPSPRSDIYSFCVTLHEAVTGVRPGTPPLRRAPAWLDRAMARGLRARPEDRWPSMRALLDVLARGPRITKTRVATAAFVLMLASAAVVGARERLLRAPPPCPSPEHAFDGIWDDAQRAAVDQTLRASGHDSALAYIRPLLDEYRAAWVRAEVDTCAATRVRGEQSEHLLDLRMACLEDRRRSIGRTVSLLSRADEDIASHGVEIVSQIPGVDTCANVRSLEASPPPAAGTEGAVANAKLALDDARALFYAGKPGEAHARLEPAIADMTRVAYAPLDAQLLYWRGNAEFDLLRPSECEATLVAAAVQALDARDDAILAQTWTLLGFAISSRPDQARAWVEQAGAAIRRLGGDDELEGERLLSLGAITRKPDEKKADLLRARELLVKTRGADFYLVATVDQRLGNAALDAGHLDEAMTFHARALGLRRRLFGIDHRATVSSTFNVAEDAIGRKRPAEAREALRELGTRIAQHPPAERAWYAIKLGDIERLEGSLSAALEEHQQAIALYDAMPERDPIFGVAYFDVGRDLLDLGRPKEAIGALESAARLWEAIGNDEAADAWLELGLAYFGSGDAARGRQLVRRAQAVYAKSPELADPEMHAKADAWLASHG